MKAYTKIIQIIQKNRKIKAKNYYDKLNVMLNTILLEYSS